MGNAAVGDFIRDSINLTVDYIGAAGLFDWTFRRMILHYANLCVIAGGVNLFVIGSELRGLEILRGPTWTKPGAVDGSGNAIWDYPMVAAAERARQRRPDDIRQRRVHQKLDDSQKT